MSYLSPIFLAAALSALAVFASGAADPFAADPAYLTPSRLADLAVSADTETSDEAVTRLRAAGPDGLTELTDHHAEAIAALRTGEPPADPVAAARLTATLDAVAGQKDAAFSELYWFDDLDAARSRAASTGKPILSLHLLGDLTEAKSCANSRFFRTVLYPDPAVNAYLKEHFVLHWHNVRSAPALTIDLGDGRRVERTLTGNSVHYVLNAHGDVLDGVPGLVSAPAFLASLEQSTAMVEDMQRQRIPKRVLNAWKGTLATAARPSTDPFGGRGSRGNPFRGDVPFGGATAPFVIAAGPAEAAMGLTASKMALELPALGAALLVAPQNGEAPALVPAPSVVDERGALSEPSLSLIRAQNPGLAAAAFDAMITRFRQTLADDTARNQGDLQPRLRAMLAEHDAPPGLSDFNARVYAELFATPLDDPWMGLDARGVYTGLVDGGLVGP